MTVCSRLPVQGPFRAAGLGHGDCRVNAIDPESKCRAVGRPWACGPQCPRGELRASGALGSGRRGPRAASLPPPSPPAPPLWPRNLLPHRVWVREAEAPRGLGDRGRPLRPVPCLRSPASGREGALPGVRRPHVAPPGPAASSPRLGDSVPPPAAAGVRRHGAQGRGLRDHPQSVREDHSRGSSRRRQLVPSLPDSAGFRFVLFNDLVVGKETGQLLDLSQ